MCLDYIGPNCWFENFHNLPPEPVFFQIRSFSVLFTFPNIGQNKSRWRLLLTATLFAIKNKSQFTELQRLCRDCVPTRRRLLDKGVNCPSNCVSCRDGEENSFHLFILCSKSIECWKRVGLWPLLQRISSNGELFASVIFSFLQVSNQDHKAIFSVTLWSIWKGRNNQVWNQVEESPTLICQRDNQLLTDWKEAQKYRLNNEIINSPPAIIRWEKPQEGRFKCNIDAAFSHNKVGFGACIRDELGNFIVARTEWFSPCTDVVIGEALGLLKAVNWVHDMGYDNMDFELDAKRVVDSVTNPRPNDSDLGAITGECN
ncbi:uncharacterized protein LOC131625327 [Vicia villosa]|uniref:uncharacterized protein LOC131625327 n=1 Tax=Vicia villosa TaxID=3911 RepID=UPI00273BEFDB|nr:uncharacterized protein LOC131625327 [Vicia villosa]